MADQPATSVMDQIVALAKRRGFIYPASDIYGGIRGFWDYGPLGVLLKNNIRDHWWHWMVECPPIGPDGEIVEMVGLDSAIIQHPKTWEASGHAATFADPMRKCTKCGHIIRADHWFDILTTTSKWFESVVPILSTGVAEVDAEALTRWAKNKGVKLAPNLALSLNPNSVPGYVEEQLKAYKLANDTPHLIDLIRLIATDQNGTHDPCVLCGAPLGPPEQFNLMMVSYAGLQQTQENLVYLRPETAQGIFLNFKNIVDTSRVKVPFGVAQIGKSFRNEVTPRNFIFRSREFEQMEMEFFCPPDDALKWYDFWKDQRMKWWLSLGVEPGRLRFRDHDADELSHYSKATVDIEYRYPFTDPDYGELEGIAHRGDYDLTQHQKFSGQKLDYFDQELQLKLKEQGASAEEIKQRTRYVPNVIEPASGLTRAVLVLLCEAYTPDAGRPSGVYLKFKPKFAPIKLGIFPLVAKDGMPEKARELYMDLRTKFACEFDVKQSIGKRYARMDEIGTPFCCTIDGDTMASGVVTIRHRDTQQQEKIDIGQVGQYVSERLR